MKLLICGDFATVNRGQNAVVNGSAISSSVCSVLRQYESVIVNLEAPVVCGAGKGIDKIGPNLRTDRITVDYLKDCGFRYITLANNHFYDYGDKGIVDTMESLTQNKIQTVGGGRNNEEKETPLLLDDNNICILNYCESEFSVDHEMGSNKLDAIKAYYDIKNAVLKKCFVVVIVHGGHEGYQLPSPRMKQLYHFFIDCGANAVVNHHQHCYSGYESYNGGLIFFGLGNFFFDSISKNFGKEWFEGYMVGLDIQNGKLVDFKLYPYYQCKGNIIETCLMEEDDKKEFFKNINALNIIIGDDEKLQNEFLSFAESIKLHELVHLIPYSNRVLQALYKRHFLPSFLCKKKKLQLLNMLRCESHRDICVNLLKKMV